MHISFANLESKIVSMFMTNNGSIFKGNGYDEYLPLLEEFEFKPTSELKLVHKKDVYLNIDTYDSTTSNKQLNDEIKRTKKIDISSNDVLVDGSEIVLNFTDRNIVVYNKYNIPHLCLPLENKVLREKYRGNIIILTIHRLNNPNIISDIFNNDKSYIKVLKEAVRYKKNNKYDEFKKVIDFVDENWDKVDYFSNDFRSSSIKVITVSKVDGNSFMPGNEKYTNALFLINKSLLFTCDSIYHHKDNPYVGNDVDLAQFKVNVIPGSKFIYIVDNKDKLNINDDCSINVEEHYTLEELDKSNFIYKTIEEAETGADKTTLLAQQNKARELELQSKTIENQNASILLKKADFEEKSLLLKQKYEEMKTKLEESALLEKFFYDKNHYKMKNDYEEDKYKRDTTVETLKTIASVAGVIATGYVIIKQFKKA